MNRALIEYLGDLEVSQGRLAGENLMVLPWQRRFIMGAFQRGSTSAAISVARANGKTTLVAGIAAATLDGPLMVPRGETVIVASSFEQARIAFEHVIAFMGSKLRDRKVWKVWDTAQQARIENRETGARVRCIGSDPRRAHGLAPVLVLADEPSQWPPATGERMVAALRTASGKQPHSRYIALGTRPDAEEHWFSRMLEGGADYSQCHAARPGDPPFWRRTWKRANPSLDYLPDLEAAIRAEAKLAKSGDTSTLASFLSVEVEHRHQRHNVQRVDVGEALVGVGGRRGGGARAVLGRRFGNQRRLSPRLRATALGRVRLDVLGAFPGQPSLKERGLADGVGSLYADAASRGELITTGRHAVHVGALLREALSRFGRPSVVVADRWREAELRDALRDAGVPPASLTLRGMGYRDGGADTLAFRRACLERRVVPVVSLYLRSCMACARTISDPAGNQKLAKSSQGGRRQKSRDDGAAASILAVSEGVRRGRQPARRRRVAVAGVTITV